MRLLIAVVGIIGMAAPAFAQTWAIADTSSAEMMVSTDWRESGYLHWGVRQSIKFRQLRGTVEFDGKDIRNATVNAVIETRGADTKNDERNKDLRSANLLNVGQYPRITFKSKRVEPAGSEMFRLIGDLTIKDVTREITFNVEGPTRPIVDRGFVSSRAVAKAKVNGNDFGLTLKNLFAGQPVGDEFELTIAIEMRRLVS